VAASIFNGTAVKILKDILKFNDGTTLASSDAANLSGLTSNVQDQIDDVVADVGAIPDPISYQGVYNATTNSPALDDTDVGAAGHLYQVTVAGTQDFGSGNISFEVGDKVVNNGFVWEKWDMTDSVSSVNSQVGAVSLDATDVGAANDTLSNLGTTDINSSLLFNASNTFDIGTPSVLVKQVNANILSSANQYFGPYTDAFYQSGDGYGIAIPNTAATDHLNIAVQDHVTNSTNAGIDISISTGKKGGASSTGNTGSTYRATGDNFGTGDTGTHYDYTGSNAGTGDTGGYYQYTGDSTIGNTGGFEAGTGAPGTGNSGGFNYYTADAAAGDSGGFNFTIGSASGTQGAFKFLKTGVASVIGQIWTATDTAGTGYWAARTVNKKETFTLTGGNITNGYIDLLNVALTDSIDFVFNGLLSRESTDYTVSYTGGAGGKTRITFSAHSPALVAGNVIIIKYQY
jgi:hypothetical protein